MSKALEEVAKQEGTMHITAGHKDKLSSRVSIY
jgi:hypothetical protein